MNPRITKKGHFGLFATGEINWFNRFTYLWTLLRWGLGDTVGVACNRRNWGGDNPAERCGQNPPRLCDTLSPTHRFTQVEICPPSAVDLSSVDTIRGGMYK